MFGYQQGFGNSFCQQGPGYGRPVGRGSYGGSTFVLIVVLFVLLIIVGRSFV